MPTAPLKLCNRPGCGGLTVEKYCDNFKEYGHQKKVAAPRDKNTDSFYGTAAWQRFRNDYKSKNPLHEDRIEERRTVSVYCIDHIVELKDGGDPFNEDSSRSRCRICHARKTAAEKRNRKAAIYRCKV